jgi:hypothetical protein
MLRNTILVIAMAAVGTVLVGRSRADDSTTGSHAGPSVSIKEDESRNGWTILQKFKGSDKYARTGETWTLDEAKELVEDIKKQTSSLDKELQAAELLVVGKDGDGKVKENQGPALPDWPEIENQFRALTPERSEAVTAALKELGAAYEEAQKLIEESLRRRRQLAQDEMAAIDALVSKYHRKLADLQKTLFQGRTVPLPRFSPVTPDMPRHTETWAAAREAQYDAEQFGSHVRAEAKDLKAERDGLLDRWRIVFKDDAERNQESVDAKKELTAAKDKYNENFTSFQKDRDLWTEARKEAAKRIADVQKQVLDKSSVLPPADRFVGSSQKATYTSNPGVKVLKKDQNGVPLPSDKQPAGYPRAYVPGTRLAPDELRYVDPELRVAPQGDSETVQAGIPGRVVRVNPDNRSVVIGDVFGNQLRFGGIDPAGLKPGDYVNPQTPIGRLPAAKGRTRELCISAVNSRRRFVNPVELFQYYANRPTVTNQSTPPGPAPDPELLPVKGGTKPELLDKDGKGAENWRLTFDDSISKDKLGSLTRTQVDLKEAVAKTALDRLQQKVNDATDKLSSARQKKREADAELDRALATLKEVQPKAEGLLQQARNYRDQRAALQQEMQKLESAKNQLDTEKQALQNSKDERAIEAYNAKARDLNAKLQDFERRKNNLRDPSDQIAALRRQRDQAEKDKAYLEKKKGDLEAAVSSAQADLDRANNDLKQKQQELQSLAAQKEKLKAEEDAAKEKKPGD